MFAGYLLNKKGLKDVPVKIPDHCQIFHHRARTGFAHHAVQVIIVFLVQISTTVV